MNFSHTTVFLEESVNFLSIKSGSVVLDATAGGGGHTEALLSAVGSSGLVFAVDRDPQAIEWLQKRFRIEIENGRLILIHQNFSEIFHKIQELGYFGKFDGILLDLGVSSPQLDQASRGFSFSKDGPLDMRMNPQEGVSISEFLKTVDEKFLADMIWKYGEEPQSRRIARGICHARSFQDILTTSQLVEIIAASVRYREKSKRHVATKTFQALRIYINRELSSLELFLHGALDLLKPQGGRLAMISFHSLEDRIIKTYMKDWSADHIMIKVGHSSIHQDKVKRVQLIKPFPFEVSCVEKEKNSRSRSAKLRVCEKF